MAKTTAGRRVPNSKFIVEGEKGQVDHSDVMAALALSVTEKPKSLLKYDIVCYIDSRAESHHFLASTSDIGGIKYLHRDLKAKDYIKTCTVEVQRVYYLPSRDLRRTMDSTANSLCTCCRCGDSQILVHRDFQMIYLDFVRI